MHKIYGNFEGIYAKNALFGGWLLFSCFKKRPPTLVENKNILFVEISL